MLLPVDYLPIRSGLYASVETIDRLADNGPRWQYHDAKLIDKAMQSVRRWYYNLKRPGFEDAYCAVCSIPQRHDNDGKLIDCGSCVFMVYFRLEQFGKLVFDWEWKFGSPVTGLLVDGDGNFGEPLTGEPQ